MNFTDKTAIVTGGSRGIGFAIAKVLCEAGTNVMICGRNKETIQKAVDSLELFGSVAGVQCDVTNYDEVRAMMQATKKKFGSVDILINNAGVAHNGDIEEHTPETWTETINTNLTGVFYCCRVALPHLQKNNSGWIINISSLASKNPFPGGSAYCASKSALNAFSEVLMQEVRHDGIRVAHVLPGSVKTNFRGQSGKNIDWKLSPEDVAEVVTDLLMHPARSLPSRVELRPSRPPRGN